MVRKHIYKYSLIKPRGKNMSSDKIDESEFFIPRGTKKTNYKVGEKVYPIEIYVPDNYEHDKMMEEFTSYNEEKETVEIKTPELLEARLLRFLKRAPFTCSGVAWNKASEAAKTKTVRELNPEHKSAINRAILGKEVLTVEESDFLFKE